MTPITRLARVAEAIGLPDGYSIGSLQNALWVPTTEARAATPATPAHLCDVSLMGHVTMIGVTVEPSPLVGGGILVDRRLHYGPLAVYKVPRLPPEQAVIEPEPPAPPDPYKDKLLTVRIRGMAEFREVDLWRRETPATAPVLIRRVLSELKPQSTTEHIGEVLEWLNGRPGAPLEHEICDSDDIPF